MIPLVFLFFSENYGVAGTPVRQLNPLWSLVIKDLEMVEQTRSPEFVDFVKGPLAAAIKAVEKYRQAGELGIAGLADTDFSEAKYLALRAKMPNLVATTADFQIIISPKKPTTKKVRKCR